MCVVCFDCVMHQPRILKCGNYKVFANLADRNARDASRYFNKVFNNFCYKRFTKSHPVLGFGFFFCLCKALCIAYIVYKYNKLMVLCINYLGKYGKNFAWFEKTEMKTC